VSIRLDVVTIFPDYLAPLDLSLIGKARREGLVDLHVHDLRDFTHDRHRTVDDTPFGGGAGMVMKPQPWAEALDHVLAQPLASGNVVDRASTRRTQEGLGYAVPRLIVPGPGGVPFSQALAHELAAEAWLAFACGRYEGLDERVYEHAAERMPVTVVSLGDYVLNGGEVAVLAMVEAIVRLVPGVVGNAESLVEESHEDSLLEYPVYTKPAVWDDRGTERPVPPILLSGNHCAIAQWRHQQRLERTAARRPDLLHPSATGGALAALDGRVATAADAPNCSPSNAPVGSTRVAPTTPGTSRHSSKPSTTCAPGSRHTRPGCGTAAGDWSPAVGVDALLTTRRSRRSRDSWWLLTCRAQAWGERSWSSSRPGPLPT